ncbi:MAG: hypothetical protein K0S80_2232 [Neobacillus sp.]|nr:hypothetical protein [Neobacillus sp.]
MKKHINFAVLLLVLTCGILGNSTLTDATSKKQLEEIVMEHEMEMDSLKSQLAEVTKQLETIKNNPVSNEETELRLSINETNINTLMRIHRIDENSVNDYVSKFQATLKNSISTYLPYHSLDQDYFSGNDDSGPFGSLYYNIFDYISEAEVKQMVRDIYYEIKTDEMNYKTARIYFETPDRGRFALEVSLNN